MRRIVVVLVLAIGLAACRDRDEPPPDPKAAAVPAVIDAQLQAIEKAKAVEAEVLESKQRTDEALDEASGGG